MKELQCEKLTLVDDFSLMGVMVRETGKQVKNRNISQCSWWLYATFLLGIKCPPSTRLISKL